MPLLAGVGRSIGDACALARASRAAGDGLRVRRCRRCGREEGPFPAPEDPIRLDPRDVPPGGS